MGSDYFSRCIILMHFPVNMGKSEVYPKVKIINLPKSLIFIGVIIKFIFYAMFGQNKSFGKNN